jgi:TP901 family phage tail tape measure protein
MTVVSSATIELRGDATHFERTMARAFTQFKTMGQGVKSLDKGLVQAENSLYRFSRNLRSIGSGLTASVTLPLLAVAGSASKAAIGFESSFAGIRKTMDLTEAEFGRLAQANRDLAKTIPVSVNELNRIGELAGQLGIRGVDNVLKFEDTIAKLAVTTDLTADQAALSFAQIANVMQLPQGEIDRLGAAVVGLGNNFATTESRIVDFTTRIAGAGKIAGLSVADVAGIGTAFASLGVNAESGGTAVQKVLLKMVSAVVSGGAALETFARTSGMSAAEFRQAFKDDAAGAFVAFVEGLGASGDSAIAILNALGLSNERVRASFLAAAGAGDLVSRAVAQANSDFKANSALSEEAAKRFATMASQLGILWGQLKDVGITLGTALMPALKDLVDISAQILRGVARMATAFANLPKSVRLIVIGFAALAAAAGPMLLVLSSMIGGLASLVLLLNTAAGASLLASLGGIGGLLVAGGPIVAGAIVAAGAIGLLIAKLTQSGREAKKAREELSEFRDSLGQPVTIDLVRDFEVAASLAAVKVAEIKDAIEAAKAAGDTEARFRLTGELEKAEEALKRVQFRAGQLGKLDIETEATVRAKIEVEEASLSRALDRIDEVKSALERLPEGRLRSSQENILDRLQSSATEAAARITELEGDLVSFGSTAGSAGSSAADGLGGATGVVEGLSDALKSIHADLRQLEVRKQVFDLSDLEAADERVRVLESALQDLIALDLSPSSALMRDFSRRLDEASAAATRLRDPMGHLIGQFQEIERLDLHMPDFSDIGGQAFRGQTIAVPLDLKPVEKLSAPNVNIPDLAALTPAQRQKFIDGVPFDELTGKIQSFGQETKELLFGVGEDMITGLIQGTLDMGDILKRFILGFVGRFILGPFSEALGIASPSKVFADIGQNLGRGLVSGMKSMEPIVRNAALTLAAAAAVSVPPIAMSAVAIQTPTSASMARAGAMSTPSTAIESRAADRPIEVTVEALFDAYKVAQSAGGQVLIREGTNAARKQGWR